MTQAKSKPAISADQTFAAFPVAIASVVGGVLIITASGDDGFAICPFRRCTGGYCPGCGGTRALHRLGRGDVVGAWQHHPWVVLLAVQCVIVGVVLVFAPAWRERLRQLLLPVVVANAILAIGLWVLRLQAGSIPTGWLG
ncbi:MAG: cytochrome bd-type quinol oxidase subunit 2 [Candidatus Aldehydirespiratoraceae bacterium]|jgi:cytochrome bd-type quinol oxidase subunit 2